ncbi:Zinc finger and SCAN domain-containing protein 2 [Cyphomyrmex costatus]|uniref:Zinc finger and SCAN domain-containing protein 2 n=1 Tax=Cyphomyrmex costatus TaxID=456900 RepID=A0A195CQA2_9HYME|nr:Zinc finger and SCAN domain-containing protein 2 [Cyphomyrmex costatus]
METHEAEQYVTFPLGEVHDATEENMISHEEICEQVDECVLQEGLTEVTVGNTTSTDIVESQDAVEILAEQSEDEDDTQVVYPMYIKQEEQQQYTSGDDESMAVEALRQLGGMYPCFEDKKISCPVCKHLFTQEEMIEHQTVCQSTPKLSCTTCGEKFERKIDLNNHMVCHQVDRPHACRTCGNLFRSKQSLQSHTLQAHTQHVERPHKCTICGLDFQRPSSLSNHMKIHTYVAGRAIMQYNNTNKQDYTEAEMNNSKQYTCKHCGMKFSRATALASHEKIHASKNNWNMPIECEYCDKQFQDENHLTTHQTTCAKKIMQNNIEQGVPNNKWGKHACSECGKKFTTKQKMFRHQWIHRKKTHSCEVCGSQFEKQNELDEHRLSAHPGDSPFTCMECGKSFVSRQGLWEHGRTHAGSPAHFQCDTCLKTFSSRQGYLIHNRTHTGERPYGCKYCWKAFRDGGTLRKHERIHTGERPHVCPLCSRAFNQKVVLREHVRWVHAAGKNETEGSSPPYQCPLCGALNQDRDELCAHIVKHSDQMIAEAKAKTNNDASPKPKSVKKKSSKSSSCSVNTQTEQNLDFIQKAEQNEALLSITDTADKSDDMHDINEKQNDAFVVVTAEKHDGFIAISDLKHSNIRFIVDGKENENIQVLQVSDQDPLDTDSLDMIAINKQNDATNIMSAESDTLDETVGQNDMPTIHLIESKQDNTLNIISKQNESLPVLAIPNPQNHENYSSQIVQISGTDMSIDVETLKEKKNHIKNDQDCLMSDETSHVIIQYQHDSDDENDLVCEICDERFEGKAILKEHIKIHI